MSAFDHASSLFEPTSYDTSSFLSFSSFGDLTLSPFDETIPLPTWDDEFALDTTPLNGRSEKKSAVPLQRALSTYSSLSESSASPSDPFEIIASAFEPATPVYSGNFGIFHTPSKAGPSKISSSDIATSSYNPHIPHHRSISSDWDSPVTPPLTTKSSIDSFTSYSTGYEAYIPRTGVNATYAWDEQSLSTTSSSSSSKFPSPVTSNEQVPVRVASNPNLGGVRNPRPIKQVSSMPALKEEEAVISTPSQWFDGTGLYETTPTADNSEENLLDNFDWVFGDFGLGDSSVQDDTIFSAFQTDDTTQFNNVAGDPGTIIPQPIAESPNQALSWAPDAAVQDSNGLSFDVLSTDFIDPMAIMAHAAEDESRPTTAPQSVLSAPTSTLLNIPSAGVMMRSVSSESVFQPRHAAPRDLFSYTPQQLSTGPPAPPPLYTTAPSPSYTHVSQMSQQTYPRANTFAPGSTSSTSQSIRRPAAQELAIQIQPTTYSTYQPQSSYTLLTPDSAVFPGYHAPLYTHLPQQPHEYPQLNQSPVAPQPIAMTRGATQPIPGATANRRHVTAPTPPTTAGNMPAHLLRAQAIVQMQEAKEEAQRQELRRQAATRKVGMAEASVMQPSTPPPTSHSRPVVHHAISGWEPTSHQVKQQPVLTTAPLVNVHPPPAHYYVSSPISIAPGSSSHRVHPPPHPGMMVNADPSRPIARLPSGSPGKRRQVSAPSQVSPNAKIPKRSPSGGAGRRRTATGGAFSWNEATFINFTSEDAEKLLSGVAPSGSQTKRRREEEEGLLAAASLGGEAMDRTKRSRTGEAVA